MLRKLCVLVTSASLLASSANAALLISVEGAVMVNKGEGFVDVGDVAEVKPGDRVLVRGEGSAQIDYGDGCVVEVSDNQSVVIAEKSTCTQGTLHSTTASSGPTPITPGRTGSLKDAPAEPVQQPEDHSLLLLGGIAAVGVGIGVCCGGGGGGDKPASP